MSKKAQGGIRYGRQSVVRFEWAGRQLGSQETTVQRLLSAEYAADWLHDQLTCSIIPDLKKAAKVGQKVSLESIVKRLQGELREYRKTLAGDCIGSDCQVTVIPRSGCGSATQGGGFRHR